MNPNFIVVVLERPVKDTLTLFRSSPILRWSQQTLDWYWGKASVQFAPFEIPASVDSLLSRYSSKIKRIDMVSDDNTIGICSDANANLWILTVSVPNAVFREQGLSIREYKPLNELQENIIAVTIAMHEDEPEDEIEDEINNFQWIVEDSFSNSIVKSLEEDMIRFEQERPSRSPCYETLTR
jgi:hypothetical protein